MNPILQRQLISLGWMAAAAAAVFTLLWVTALIAVPGAIAETGLAEQLAHLRDAGLAGSPAPLLSLPLAFLFVPVWLGLAALAWEKRPAAGVLAVCFGLLYVPFVTLNYWSQATVVRGLAELAAAEPAAVELYRLFAFGELTSFGYAFNLLGYAVWGLAGVSIAAGLWVLDGRLARATAGFFALSGVLAIIGATGFVLGSALLEFAVLVSGVASLAATIVAAVLLRRPIMPGRRQVAVTSGTVQ
jgi:hypothetical protein